MSNYLSYDHVNPYYQCYMAKFTHYVEPRTIKKVAKDDRWVAAMKQDIQALKDNQTWKVVDLPPQKHKVGSK